MYSPDDGPEIYEHEQNYHLLPMYVNCIVLYVCIVDL